MSLVRTLDSNYVWFEDPAFVVKRGKEKDSTLEAWCRMDA